MKRYTLKEYEKSGNMLYIDGRFYSEFRDFLEDEAEKLTVSCLRGYEIPIIYGTEKEVIGFHAGILIELLEEHDAAYEDYEVDDAAKDFIKDFVKTFNRKHAGYTCCADKEVVIELTAEEKAETIKTLKRRIKELKGGTNMQNKVYGKPRKLRK